MLRTAMAAVLVLTAVAAGTPAHAAGGRTTIVVRDGATQPVFDYADAIHEHVWVESPTDTDHDGVRDRIHLEITRPGETETAGLRVASLIMPTPYGGIAPEVPYPDVDVDRLPQEGAPATLSATHAADRALTSLNTAPAAVSTWEYYTTRGYAMIAMDSIGTATSTGCPDAGGPAEIVSTRAVVDWLDGRGRAFDADGNVVSARWSARSVGMYGVSYNGTLPIMAAITGRSALKTIIPMSAVTSWYDYYRANGLVVAPGGWQGEDLDIMAKYVLSRTNPEVCASNMDHLERVQDRTTGDYSPVWAARDYTARAGRIEASVFVVQGLQDWNVKPKHGIQLWQALRGDKKLWLYDRGHGSSCAPEFAPAMHRWVDHYLYRVDSGIEDEAPVTLEDNGCRVTGTDRAWPAPGTRAVTFPLATGRPRTDTFVDEGRTRTAEQLLSQPAHALTYQLPVLTEDTRLSGTPWITADVSIDRTAANLTALLVDYAPDGTATILTRGWTDPQNRRSVSRSEPVTPGRTYRLRWDLQPIDRTVPAGHRLGVVVISTDYDYTLRPLPGTRVSVRPVSSTVQLPMR
ncbi:CocE/NonD family hydrolase [Catenuloplanes atrovinosus]|uniref:Xaa-Pro dipeptidyl-peptidase n=1 Tax=Catenuloplanes atrovinosus TaxID=137266 RepID=A0AAE4CA30_9ACTN|nr:CocE/NonD family hydrolase [Catenuloplanes atrovinosus]MDR7274215.1 X-Pro dipeptidyl-peptidase [Catenuloplanes atrovinosus]